MKTCFKCGSDKPSTDEFFYRHARMADGLLGKCKECTKKDASMQGQKPHALEAKRVYQKTKGKEIHAKALRRQIFLYPDKYKARVKFRNAVRDGKVFQGPCWCGNPKSEGHHEDYSKPLEVVWLCNKHHKEADKKKFERDRLSQTGNSAAWEIDAVGDVVSPQG